MSGIIKEVVLKGLREWIEAEGDFVLREGRIKVVRYLLDGLEEIARREIKPIDFPLYFWENKLYQYAPCGYSDDSWFLIREDADPDVLAWASSMCKPRHWYIPYQSTAGNEFEEGKPHPLYPGFGGMVAFGNKVTPIKRYYRGSSFEYHRDDIERGLRKRLGDRCWTKTTLPRDIDGKTVYRG